MPIITLEAGKMDKEKKEKLMAGFTKVASETLGIGPEHFYVLVKENDLDNWGIGGEMLSEIYKNNSND